MPARARRTAGVLGAVTALVTAGCFLAPAGEQTEGADRPAGRLPTTAQPRPTGTVDVDGTDTVEEFREDIDAATAIAEQYWRAQLEASGIAFQPVETVVPYSEDGEIACGGQALGRNNAAYCSAGDFIAYDQNWAFAQFREIGDAFLFYLLGHEYAHAIQIRLGIRAEFTIQQELQADCMAGAYIGDSTRGERPALRLADGDIDELRAGLRAVADAPGQPWFAEGSHGSAQQRTTAFANGYNDSLQPCGLT
ncbi:neutral zinc metallopeptidase [Spirilliplanes yamanashiensis]|uniref:Metalloprotease n=1 Tax=Spirilliplanes yamanashiensis TaxID=42233 RepID=A0A8J4DK89_9ACTN|nr:neutral zinc metallopeptidase [Spirilliplanes yamanashiensis]MDP9817836.1 putative metalloprotease [Spirilliplanes yamanashiensis]GIJ04646.1 hypothetical protein Sya03_39980 [Spirilliplanes yamanashiensis]